MVSPPKLLDQIQTNLVCELLTCMGHTTSILFWPRPLGPWGGVKGSNIIKFELQRQFLSFLYQLYVCSHKLKIQIYQTGFSFCLMGNVLGVGLWVLKGQKLNFVCPAGMLSPPQPLDEIQPNLVCDLFS